MVEAVKTSTATATVVTAAALSQHPPAVKVGGRRLSVSSRPHKPHVSIPSEKEPSSPAEDSDSTPSRSDSASPSVPFDDYPRPSDPSQHQNQNQHQEQEQEHRGHREHRDDVPPHRKDKKHGPESEVQNRKEDTMPTRDHHGHRHGQGGGARRIVQPAGKVGL
ncbi:hypothetical protein D9757_006963 [Collybiopsis confluens]|uniref:Uncharacterized protein n=1 Tax=Collybiopsis confluens TaxID=2823264 RepID=A0A8H5M7T1_9AGAR|nr:hypothetical protein D9757_006963 [Collybiopsis confluens]